MSIERHCDDVDLPAITRRTRTEASMLILLRHGRTKANAGGLLQGRIDPSLDNLGQRQAAAAARWIGPVDRIVSSPLVRAQETAGAFGAPLEIDPRFAELDYGDWEGRPVSDVEPEVWKTWRSDLDFRPPNGETLNELGVRTRLGLDDLIEDAAQRDVVVVSHVSPIKASVAWALGVDDAATWRMYLGQAAICRIDVRGGSGRLVEFNSTAPLRDVEEAD